MANFYFTHNFETGEHFGFDVISLKVSQTELQSSRKSDSVWTQYADREIPPICGIYFNELPPLFDTLEIICLLFFHP